LINFVDRSQRANHYARPPAGGGVIGTEATDWSSEVTTTSILVLRLRY